MPSYVIVYDLVSLLWIYFSQTLGHKCQWHSATVPSQNAWWCVAPVSTPTQFPETSVTVCGVNNTNWGGCIHQWLQKNLLDQSCIAILLTSVFYYSFGHWPWLLSLYNWLYVSSGDFVSYLHPSVSQCCFLMNTAKNSDWTHTYIFHPRQANLPNPKACQAHSGLGGSPGPF